MLSEKEVGQRIRRIRDDNNLDQKQFATRIGTTVSSLSNWENGRNYPKQKYIDKICELFNIPKEHFNKETSLFEIFDFNDAPNIFNFEDKNGFITTRIEEVPINDFHFHINDTHNTKYFQDVELDTIELLSIGKVIRDYLLDTNRLKINQLDRMKKNNEIDEESYKQKYKKLEARFYALNSKSKENHYQLTKIEGYKNDIIRLENLLEDFTETNYNHTNITLQTFHFVASYKEMKRVYKKQIPKSINMLKDFMKDAIED